MKILDARANIFIQNVLKDGNALALKILNHVDLKKGTIYTIVPDYVGDDELYEFNVGGKIIDPTLLEKSKRAEVGNIKGIAVPTPNLDREMIAEIVKHSGSEEGTLIFENQIAVPSDPFLKNGLAKIFFFNNEVFQVLTGKISSDALGGILKEVTSVRTYLGFYMRGLFTFDHLAEISEMQLSEICKRIELIVVGDVYDGEGFLIWKKS